MKLAIRILPLLLLAAIAHAAQTPQPASPPKQANTGSHFIVSLLQNAAKANSGNICLCPYSAAETITLLAPGAAPQTRLELENALGDLSPLIKAGKADSLYIESANRTATTGQNKQATPHPKRITVIAVPIEDEELKNLMEKLTCPDGTDIELGTPPPFTPSAATPH